MIDTLRLPLPLPPSVGARRPAGCVDHALPRPGGVVQVWRYLCRPYDFFREALASRAGRVCGWRGRRWNGRGWRGGRGAPEGCGLFDADS